MNPLMIWVTEHLGAILVCGFLVAALLFYLGTVAMWRAAKGLRTPAPRPWIRLVAALLLVVASGAAMFVSASGLVEMGPALRAQRGMVGQPAPELEFTLVESDLPGSLADFRGRVVLVNVWATWCPPCVAEMSDLDRLQKAHAEDGLVVLHVSDEDRDTLRAWLEERPVSTVHAYVQPLPWPDSGRPTSYIVDRQGTLSRVLLGPRSYEQFMTEIERYL